MALARTAAQQSERVRVLGRLSPIHMVLSGFVVLPLRVFVSSGCREETLHHRVGHPRFSVYVCLRRPRIAHCAAQATRNVHVTEGDMLLWSCARMQVHLVAESSCGVAGSRRWTLSTLHCGSSTSDPTRRWAASCVPHAWVAMNTGSSCTLVCVCRLQHWRETCETCATTMSSTSATLPSCAQP